jgi:hypothetical protein
MTEAKYTTGPWFLTGIRTLYVEAKIGGGLVQEVAACGPTHQDGGYGDQQKANARLIAAAPELLEASMKVLEWFEAEDDHSKADFYQRMQMCRDAEEMIRAAITKATGN